MALLVVGMTRKDIRQSRMEHEVKIHPHAKKWRKRPMVHVLIDSGSDYTWLRHTRKTDYRKVTAISEKIEVKDGLLLKLPAHSSLPHGSLKQAIMQFNSHPSLGSIELLPTIARPALSTGELFDHYYILLSAPLADMRNGLGLRVASSPFPTLINHASNQKSFIPRIAVQIFHVVNLTLFTHAIYSAVIVTRPELLLLYSGLFGLWALWSIMRYPAMSLRLKILYVLLLPTSLVYFVYRLITTPLRSMGIQARPQNAIIK